MEHRTDGFSDVCKSIVRKFTVLPKRLERASSGKFRQLVIPAKEMQFQYTVDLR